MKLNEFYNKIPDLKVTPGMTIKMNYGHVGVITIRPIRISKLGQEVYIVGDNNRCHTVRNIKQIIEIRKP